MNYLGADQKKPELAFLEYGRHTFKHLSDAKPEELVAQDFFDFAIAGYGL
jgi:hypothetical protein